MNIQFNNKKYIALFCIAIFFVSGLVHYSAIARKGHEPIAVYEEAVLARNLSLAGSYSIENARGVILASDLVAKNGETTNVGNKLTPILYSKIFNVVGFDVRYPLYISIILAALASVLLFLIVLRLFNLKLALISSLVYILLPVTWLQAVMFGFYEFGIVFLFLAILAYLYLPKAHSTALIISSVCFGLAALSRNALLFTFAAFVLYDLYKTRSIKRAVIFVVPAVLVISLLWIPDFLTGQGNAYITGESSSIGTYGHLFGDAYTYQLDKEEFISGILGSSDPDVNEYLLRYNYPVSITNRGLMYWNSVKDYPMEALRLVDLGGPAVILLILAGFVVLYRKKRELFELFIVWLAVTYILLIALKTNNWVHFIEISFILVVTATLGLNWLIKLFTKHLSEKKKILVSLIIVLGLLGHLVISDKWMFHEEYETGNIKEVMSLSQSINKSEITDDDVIAFGWHPGAALALNYYTDKNIVLFKNSSIDRAEEKGELKEAFEYFGVTKIIGYPQDLTAQLVAETGVEEITSDYRR